MIVYVVIVAIEGDRPQVYGVYTDYDAAYKAEQQFKEIGSYFCCEDEFFVTVIKKKIESD